MKTLYDIKPITYLKKNSADLVDQVTGSRRPVVITQNGDPRVVVLDAGAYDEMRDALGLMKLISQGEEDVRHGRVKSQKEVFQSLRKRLRGE